MVRCAEVAISIGNGFRDPVPLACTRRVYRGRYSKTCVHSEAFVKVAKVGLYFPMSGVFMKDFIHIVKNKT